MLLTCKSLVSRCATISGSFFVTAQALTLLHASTHKTWIKLPGISEAGCSTCGHSRLLHKCFLVVFDLTFELWVLFSSSYQRTAEIHLPLVVREVTSGLVFRLVFPFSSRSQQPHPSKAMLGISWFSRFPVC